MLLALTIEKIALIDQLYLEFTPGLNMLTGETGAGKSIVIDAIHTVLGGRASKEIIQAGCESARVEAVFSLRDEQVKALTQLGLSCSDGTITLGRMLQSGGKSVCRINGRVTSLAQLKEAASFLMEIHGQHENQLLFSKTNHMHLLDSFGKEQLKTPIQEYKLAYREYIRYKRTLREKQLNPKDLSLRLEQLTESYEAFAALRWQAGELDELKAEIDRLSNREMIFAALDQAYHLLYEKEDAGLELLKTAAAAMEKIEALAPDYHDVYQKLQELSFGLDDAVFTLRNLRQEDDFNPKVLEDKQRRLFAFSRLQKQIGGEEADILAHFAQIKQEIDTIEEHLSHADEYRSALKEKLLHVKKCALQLSDARKQTAKLLESAILQQLADLGMDKASFMVQFTAGELGPSGMDEIEFLFSANVGESVKPLTKVASGGEISRIMLAFKHIDLSGTIIDSMVFDEIDTGISGKMAQAVAEKLYHISRRNQVLCVTHLPQVAAMADHHLFVEKIEEQGRMHVHVHALDENSRVQEIARLISGKEITENGLTHAAELIQSARRLS